ncbi:MAG: tRNA lysidine(34) synthetase TilS [Bacillota bacterium]
MEFLEQVKRTIKAYDMLKPGDRVVVAVSGGADSISLLHVLWSLREEMGINVLACHMHHGMRGDRADEDARFVEMTANSMGLAFYYEFQDVPLFARQHKLGEEEAGRRLRYQFYRRLLEEIPADKVALGHNRDDQAETVLMRILRGTGLRGLAGIPPKRGAFIRPLINSTRKDIELYCRANGLKWITDATNLDTKYLRNKIRHRIMPELEQYSPRVADHLVAVGDIARETSDFIEYEIGALRAACIRISRGHLSLRRRYIDQLEPARARQLLFVAIEQAGLAADFTSVDAVFRLVTKARPGKFLKLGRGRVYAGYDEIVLVPERPEPAFSRTALNIPGVTRVDAFGLTIRSEIKPIEEVGPETDFTRVASRAYFDYNKMTLPLEVGSMERGLRIQPFGMRGTKKVSDVLASAKIPYYLRRQIPVVYSGQRAIWIPGYVTDETTRVDKDTHNVLVLTAYRNGVVRCNDR